MHFLQLALPTACTSYSMHFLQHALALEQACSFGSGIQE